VIVIQFCGLARPFIICSDRLQHTSLSKLAGQHQAVSVSVEGLASPSCRRTHFVSLSETLFVF